jgi:aldehyde dehydrogenase (NAD+)
MNAPQLNWPAITTPAQHFIGNRWHAPQGRAELPMIDPSDGAPFAAIARGNAADIDAAVRAAQGARAGAWGKLSPAERGRLLANLSRAILDHAEELALTEARDCGKPLTQARADVAACARYFEFYGARATSCTARRFRIPKALPS